MMFTIVLDVQNMSEFQLIEQFHMGTYVTFLFPSLRPISVSISQPPLSLINIKAHTMTKYLSIIRRNDRNKLKNELFSLKVFVLRNVYFQGSNQ